MLDLVRDLAQDMDVGFAWHTGSVPQENRRREIRRFKESPDCRLFLSTDSGGVGLNLQAANVVINLDLPWNPARLEQRIARAWRKHQTRPVQVIDLVTENSIEQRMIPLLAGKQALADGVLDGRGGLTAMALPSGRKQLVQRLESLMGPSAPQEAPAAVPPPPKEPQAPGSGRLAAALLGIDQIDGIDPAALEAVQRLIAAGVLQLTAEGQRLLGVRPTPPDDRAVRLARAREIFAQAERKMRMATVLAGGGFPVEALPALREGVETALRSQMEFDGVHGVRSPEVADETPVPLGWVEKALPRRAPLVAALRGSPESVLGAGEEEAIQWITAGAELVKEIAAGLCSRDL